MWAMLENSWEIPYYKSFPLKYKSARTSGTNAHCLNSNCCIDRSSQMATNTETIFVCLQSVS